MLTPLGIPMLVCCGHLERKKIEPESKEFAWPCQGIGMKHLNMFEGGWMQVAAWLIPQQTFVKNRDGEKKEN